VKINNEIFNNTTIGEYKSKINHLKNQIKNQFEENKTKYDSLYIQNEELNNTLLNTQYN